MTNEALAFIVFSAGMLLLMGIGMNMALALVLTGAGMAWVLDFWDTQLLAQNLVAGVDSFPLLAVPFFILAGELMNSGGISRRIIDMAQAWVGHIRGGLGYVAIGAAVLMASMSGSALADTAALATILLPMMRQQGYPMHTSAGLIASGGIIAPIIPPSMPFVIYGVTTNTSISALFISGIVPGLIMGAGLIVAWRLVLRKIELPQGEPLPMRERLRATVKAFWALLMPLIIIGGMKTGIFTPTEAAVVAAFYALVVALFVHREMKLREIEGVLVRAAKTTAIVMFLCAGAQVASYMITLADLPGTLTGWLGPLVESPRLLMAVMMVTLVIIGTALDLTPTILIFAPVMLPIAVKAGIDPVYFGLMFILNGAIGLITPPVGTVLNVVAGVGRLSMHQVVKGVNPFLITYLLILRSLSSSRRSSLRRCTGCADPPFSRPLQKLPGDFHDLATPHARRRYRSDCPHAVLCHRGPGHQAPPDPLWLWPQ
jgi:tripartite ATP-independent transporter DctM subunit